MSAIYPEESKNLDVIGHLEELRKRILYSLLILCGGAIVSFWQGEYLLAWVRKPVSGLVQELIFISPTEAFVAYIKIAILSGFVITFPFILYNLWAFIAPAMSKKMKGRIVIWLVAGFILFFCGVAFSYFLAIPAALKFLLGFSEGIAVPMITLGKYVSFFGALILVGGITFEIPVIIGLLADANIVKAEFLKKKRHLAVIAIMIFAAVITPTQDILNMLIFAIPMLVLYEVGILIASIIQKSHRKISDK